MKRLWVLGLTLIFSLGLGSLTESSWAQLRQGGTLTMGIGKDLTTMNPLVTTRSTDKMIRDLNYEPLLGSDLKGNLQPYLAESWEVSRDGRLYTFHLRKGVKFHNGQEVTAEDAKFAIDYTLNPKNGAYGLTRLHLVKTVEVADKYTLKVSLKEISPPFLAFLAEISSFSVIPKESLKEGVANPDKFPPGTGPFKFIEWKPNQRIVFERFDDYWGKKALVERVVLRPVPDATVRFTALRSGDVDLIERTPYEWVKQVADGKIKGVNFVQAPYAGFRRLYFNVASPPFNNKKLRQAVAHAINKKEILRAAYFGFGEPTDQQYPKGHVWYFEGVPSPTYDLKKARVLLKEAGYKGEPIPIMARQGQDQEVEATTLQAQLKEIGMNIKLDVLEYGTYTSRQRTGDFAFMFYGGGFDPDPSLAYGPELMCEDLKKRRSNVAGYCDAEIEALIKKAEIEMNAKERRTLFKRILTKVNEDLPQVPIGYVPRFFTLRDNVKGFTTDHDGNFRPWGGGLNYAWLEKGK